MSAQPTTLDTEATAPQDLEQPVEVIFRGDAVADAVDLHRLGARIVGNDLDIVVVAPYAEAVDLCLLDVDGERLTERRYRLRAGRWGTWQGRVPQVSPGQRYGLRVHGPWQPELGLRHNSAKLLLDPYARAVTGELQLVPQVYGHRVKADLDPLPGDLPDDADSAPFVPHGVVLAPDVPARTRRPSTPWEHTVVYEAHVRGLTMLLPDVPEHLRGTYAGLAHPATIAHLRSLGVTALELLPIHAQAPEPFLVERGLDNYWGYNTLGYFAPEPSYATAAARRAGPHAVLEEVTGMVSLLHDAGIEVILDVVYNHTCEGGVDGPTLSWRGLDNTGYYLHDGAQPARLVDVTGCGNTLDFRRTGVVQLALDSLRYWVEVVGVDGFRFDLAVTLGRRSAEFDPYHPFLTALATDPVLSGVKLIAEPWDLGPGGWRTGEFPPPMADWNDRFRNAVRSFWLADPAAIERGGHARDLRDLATRLAGSADLFSAGRTPGGRGPQASINYVTAHDGFTMADLTRYERKHNEDNAEGNRDGTNDNRSWNHGHEGVLEAGGDTEARRRRSMRNLLGTLVLSAGTPMLTAGDEIGRTQRGNNNAYCQDNEISWVDWHLEGWQEDLLATVRHLLRLRREHPVVRPERFATGHPVAGDELADLAWFTACGEPMGEAAWHDNRLRALQMLRSGAPVGDADALLVLNGALTETTVRLTPGRDAAYELRWDSTWERPPETAECAAPGEEVAMAPLSMRLYLTARD